jgi:hypothetical protein
MSSLKLAKGIMPTGRILMIDTERGSGDLYADLFDYNIITLQPPYKPEKYVEAIRAGEEAGYDTIILDSLSQAWSDEGGILNQADKLGRCSEYRLFEYSPPFERPLAYLSQLGILPALLCRQPEPLLPKGCDSRLHPRPVTPRHRLSECPLAEASGFPCAASGSGGASGTANTAQVHRTPPRAPGDRERRGIP